MATEMLPVAMGLIDTFCPVISTQIVRYPGKRYVKYVFVFFQKTYFLEHRLPFSLMSYMSIAGDGRTLPSGLVTAR